MIDALSAPYSREKALDICIIDWGWEKRRGKGMEKRARSRETDCVGVCLHLSETSGRSVYVCVCECVFSCSVRVRKWNGRHYRDRRHERGKVRERSGRKGRGAGRGRELAQTRLALTQQDILSHTLHMSSPILSQNRHWSGSVEKKTGAHTSDWWNYRYVMVGWCSPGQRLLMWSKVSQQQNYSKGLTLGLTPHNRARVGMRSKGVIWLGRKGQNFRTATRKRILQFFCCGI